jgi:hypothetical protein
MIARRIAVGLFVWFSFGFVKKYINQFWRGPFLFWWYFRYDWMVDWMTSSGLHAIYASHLSIKPCSFNGLCIIGTPCCMYFQNAFPRTDNFRPIQIRDDATWSEAVFNCGQNKYKWGRINICIDAEISFIPVGLSDGKVKPCTEDQRDESGKVWYYFNHFSCYWSV